ncbi:PREDICTED: sodium channel protein Nach [Rhagoletis zephyria]|uniref:sodium channel protein Nach n=1 Tax=Rhagoletis zephyria TaxID=28612 RepID=UPI0008113246|nr:PREDICTED: sodium channel protein Nach [Rhagoletis zephyria]
MLSLKLFRERARRFLKLQFVKTWRILLSCYFAIRTAFAWGAEKLHAFGVDLGEETGILAISLIANRRIHPIERFLWFVIVFVSTFAAIQISGLQLKRYTNSPTVISVDRDYRGWHGPMPAVTLCYYDHIDSFKANEYIQNHWNVSIVDNDYFYFMDFLQAVVNATASNYVDLARFAEDERFDDVDLSELVLAIYRPFEQALTSFDKQNATIKIMPVMTERGFCYAINSPMSEILAGRSIDYKDMIRPLSCEYGKQQCFIKMDLYESTGTVDVHSPFEVSASDANIIPLHKSDEIIAFFKVLETVASDNLRDLDVDQRKCVFHDEETSQLKVYSKSLCLVHCRAVMALEMCNCVPFFYAFVEGPSCNPAGFECLLDFKWPIWALHICKCPSTCTEIEYTVQTVKKSFWGINMNEEIVNTDSVTSSFRWNLIPPKVRMRRDVVFSFEDLLVSFGGTLALYLGICLISIVRFGYVSTYHLILVFVELFVCVKDYCARCMKVLKRKKSTTLVRERSRNCLTLHKKRHTNDINTRTIERPEFEYIN